VPCNSLLLTYVLQLFLSFRVICHKASNKFSVIINEQQIEESIMKKFNNYFGAFFAAALMLLLTGSFARRKT